MTLLLRKTRWGWTATHPTGRDVAHSREKGWLTDYLTRCGLLWTER